MTLTLPKHICQGGLNLGAPRLMKREKLYKFSSLSTTKMYITLMDGDSHLSL